MGRQRIVAVWGLALGLVLAVPVCAQAQAAWDSPMLEAPHRVGGLGLFIGQPAYGGLGAMVTWSPASGPTGWGLRGGLANDDRGSGLTAFGGIDFSQLLVTAGPSFPLDVAWATGAGVGFGNDGVLVSIPGAVTLGRTVRSQDDNVALTPYLTPRLTLDLASARVNRPAPGSGTHLGLSIDLGVDAAVSSNWMLRFAATVGDHNGVAIGIVF